MIWTELRTEPASKSQALQDKAEALRTSIAAGLASGADIPADTLFDRLEAKYRKLSECCA